MRIEREYDVPPQVLLAALTDLAFLRARSQRFGGTGEPAIERADSAVVVTTPRQIPLDDIPGAFRRYVGSGALVQVDTWTDVGESSISGRWTTDAGGMPATLNGTHEIVSAAGGSRYVVTADVKVNVPLIGGRLAGEVGRHVHTLVTAEQDFLAEWVAQPSS